MWINQRLKGIVRDGLVGRLAIKGAVQWRKRIDVMLQRTVEPIWQGRIRNPWMLWADVVRHDVEENLHSLAVRRCDQVLIVLERTEVWINGVQVNGSVSVIILRSAVLHDRSKPKRGHAEILQVKETVLDSEQIATMICARLRTIMRSGSLGGLIIRGVSVCETVRHDQVNHVILRHSLKFS